MRDSIKFAVVIGLLLLAACSEAGAPDSVTDEQRNETGRHMMEIKTAMDHVSIDKWKASNLFKVPLKDMRGAALLGEAIKKEVFSEDLCKWLVIPGGKDKAADGAAVKSSGTLPGDNCSFCVPKGAELLSVRKGDGKNLKVLICPNSRNWAFFGDKIPMFFNVGAEPVIVTYAHMKRDFDITEDEWKDPAGKLFGKKAPFDKVYE